MNTFGSLHNNSLQPQLTTLDNVPLDGIDLLVNKKKKGLNDLISISIFNVEAKNKNLKIKDETLNNYLNKILLQYEQRKRIEFDNSKLSKKLSKQDILINIKYDLQRQLLLERMLNKYKKNFNILDKNQENSKFYDLDFKYFIIDNQSKDKLNNIRS